MESDKVLKEIDNIYRNIFENSQYSIILIDMEGRIELFNKRTEVLLGYKKSELIGRTHFQILIHPKKDLALFHETLNRIKIGEKVDPLLTILKCKEGNFIWTRINFSTIETDENPLIQIICEKVDEANEFERTLNLSTDILKEITNKSFFGVVIIQNNQYLYVNQTFLNITGYTKEEILNWEREKFIIPVHPDYRDTVSNIIVKLQNSDEKLVSELEFPFYTKQGILKWVYTYSKNIIIQDKKAIFTTFLDISQNKEAEIKLKESEELFRSITEQSFLGIVLMQDNYLRYVNKAVSLIIDHPFNEVLNWSLNNAFEIVHPKDRDSVMKIINKYNDPRDDDIVDEIDFRIYTKHNTLKWVHISRKTIMMQGKRTLLSVIIDITDKKYFEQELKKSEEKYRNLFGDSPVMILLLSLNGMITDVNTSFLLNFRVNRENIIGKQFQDIDDFNTINSEFILNKFKNFKKRGQIEPFEFQYRDFKSEVRWLLIRVSLINPSEKPMVQVILQDITAIKRAELLEKQKVRKLEKLDQLKNQLLDRISHELKTPLVSIYGACQLLAEVLKDKGSEQVLKYINIALNGGERLRTLIKNLLESSQLESNMLKLKIKVFDLSQLVRECANLLYTSFIQRRLSLNLEIEDKIIIYGDRERVEQVILNLIYNAIKYTPPKGKITIVTKTSENFALLKIQDTGIGFTSEEKKRLFTKFGKIEKYGEGYDIDTEGTGLGLYITKSIIELHGAEISAESRGKDMGSTFTIRFPLQKMY